MDKRRSSSDLILSSLSAAKRKRKSISLEVKMEVIRRYERGERAVDIARDMNMSESTLRTIRINTDKIKASCENLSPESVTKMSRSRSCLMETMEKQLVEWIEVESEKHASLTMSAIQEKAKLLYAKLREEKGEVNAKVFNASHGWFDRFKRRNNMKNLRVSAERCAAVQDEASQRSNTVEDVPSIFRMIIDLIEDGNNRSAGDNDNANSINETECQVWQPKETHCHEKTDSAYSNATIVADDESDDSGLTVERISLAFRLIDKALDVFYKYDHNRERSSSVASIINTNLSPYRQLYEEKLRNLTQLSNTKFIKELPAASQVQSFSDSTSIPLTLPQTICPHSNDSYASASANIPAVTSLHH